MNVHLTVGLIKKTQYKWVNIFPNPKPLGADMKVEIELSNYAIKSGLKKAAGGWYIRFF